mgnify:CR=1 FL=1|jgi:hypothetical protein|tara:strand:- start:2952 stop:3182 length:231 start_codon:yes stop_codon:yes gene_type:complete
MNYEMIDYRKPKKPQLGPWLTYSVPEKFALGYVWKLFFYMFLIPFVLGMTLTSIGLLLNFIIFDYIYYRYIKYSIS